MADDFVHMHTHCHNSAFDGLGKPNEFCEKVAEMGQSALSLTDHGTLRGLWEASKAADAAGIKLIPGAELYLADDASKRGLSDEEKVDIRARWEGDEELQAAALKEAERARRERDHVTVWAVNDAGLRNLYRLTAWSWTKGYYYKPRVDVELLCAHAEGLAVSSGCPNGVVAKLLRSPTGTGEAVRRAQRLAEVFGDRFLVEIMPHVPEEDCQDLPRKLVRLAERFGATLIATQDAHYPHASDAASQEALLCQPPGTLIRRVIRRSKVGVPRGTEFPTLTEDAPIEEIRPGDRVVSWSGRLRRGTMHTSGARVAAVSVREYAGPLVAVRTAKATSRYTPDHKAIARLDNRLTGGNYVVYVMRKGEHFRIGVTQYCRISAPRGHNLGPMYRLKEEYGDAIWILSVHDAVDGARAQEAWASYLYRLPTWTFTKPGDRCAGRKVFYSELWSRVGDLTAEAEVCLAAFGRDIRFPLLERGSTFTVRPREVRACNLLSGMLVCEPTAGVVHTYEGSGAWVPAEVSREPYSGPVYSMDVEGDHTYIADGIVTHNCVHTRHKMDDPDRFVFDERDYWLKTRPELEAAFDAKLPLLPRALVRRAMDATVAFAERCTARVPKPKAGAYLAAPPLPPGVTDYDAWLLRLCFRGIPERFGIDARSLGAEYLSRLQHELQVIREREFARYFVAAWEVRAWARSQGIMCGPGRGSGAGSLACYLLRITDLDPIRYGLSFERFLAPGRTDLPDIDLDFESLRRQEVIDHLRELYRPECVAHISTHNMLGGKRAVRDLARIFRVPEREAAAVASLVSDAYEEELKTEDTLVRVLRETEVGRAFAERYPDLAAVAPRLEGQLREVGLHASGVVMAPVPLVDLVPLETRDRKRKVGDEDEVGDGGERAKERVLAVAFDMKGAEAAGLVKLDVLGLTTLSMLRVAFNAAGRRVEEVDLEDPLALAGFTDGRFGGIFQYDTTSARRLCPGHAFRGFADVAVMTALNRPGPAKTGLAREFLLRAADPSRIRPVHPAYDAAMAETHGVPVYQEQVIELARAFGYSPEEANALRIKIAKKIGLSDESEKFAAGAAAAGMSILAAQKLFDQLAGFAAYAFGKSHSYSYAALAMWSMWLKIHYPAEFFAAALQFKAKPEVQMRLAAEARRAGIPVRPPDVNVAGSGFRVRRLDGGGAEIVGAIGDLKGVGGVTAAAVARGAPYADLQDFWDRTAGRRAKVTVKGFEILARAGALRSVFPHHRFLAANAREVWERLKAGQRPVLSEAPADFDDEEAAQTIGAVWPLYVNLAGRSAFDAVLERARAATARELLVPGDPLLAEPGPHFVMGIVSAARLYPTDDGKSVGRIIMCSADGEELSMRADADVLDASAGALTSTGQVAVAVVWTSDRGNAALERAWLAGPTVDGTDPTAAWLTAPLRTKPRDLFAALARAEEGQIFPASGQLLRVRHHLDRSEGKMMTAGLLSETGYARVLVFASRAGGRDLRAFLPGAVVRLKLKKLDRTAACLADSAVEYLEPA